MNAVQLRLPLDVPPPKASSTRTVDLGPGRWPNGVPDLIDNPARAAHEVERAMRERAALVLAEMGKPKKQKVTPTMVSGRERRRSKTEGRPCPCGRGQMRQPAPTSGGEWRVCVACATERGQAKRAARAKKEQGR